MDCIFCKIIKGDISNYTVYSDTHALAFLDINPHALGHTVVIPRTHAETLLDLNEQLYHDFFVAVKKTMELLEKKLTPDGFNVGWNHGVVGGQVVPHLHVHIMPRWENDGGTNMHGIIHNPGDKSVEEIAKLFE